MTYEYKGLPIENLPSNLAQCIQRVDEIGKRYGNLGLTVREITEYLHGNNHHERFNGFNNVFVYVHGELTNQFSVINDKLYSIRLEHGRIEQREKDEIEQALGLIVSKECRNILYEDSRRFDIIGDVCFSGVPLERITDNELGKMSSIVKCGENAVYFGLRKSN